jgi:hypothetical protein
MEIGMLLIALFYIMECAVLEFIQKKIKEF